MLDTDYKCLLLTTLRFHVWRDTGAMISLRLCALKVVMQSVYSCDIGLQEREREWFTLEFSRIEQSLISIRLLATIFKSVKVDDTEK
jgi:hypothetical protein